jgi:hypothetical protein
VTVVAVASVTVTPNAPTVKVGAAATLAATLKDDQGSVLNGRSVTWSSSAPTIATIDAASGVVTGVATGTATMTATSEGKTGSTTVTVSAAVKPVDQILLAPVLDTIEAFSSEMIGRILKDADGNVLTNREIRWTSSNPAVASIDPVTGMLTGVDRGTVTVTATSEGKTATVTRVVVIKVRSISAGTMHACDIASGGIVWCWGLNGAEGRLGSPVLGETSMSNIPMKLPGDLRFAQISTYGRHTCGITLDGMAYCWGYNGWGALGSGSNSSQSATPMAVSGNLVPLDQRGRRPHRREHRQSCVLLGEQRLASARNGDGVQRHARARGPTRCRSRRVTAGTAFTCGITTGGATYCWGANSIGRSVAVGRSRTAMSSSPRRSRSWAARRSRA